MKIIRLDVEGYRSLRQLSWEPGDLNVVIGPNGTGKSNLLRIMELVSRAAEGSLSKTIQSAGGIAQLAWDGQAEAISVRLKMAPTEPERNGESMTYELELNRLGRGEELPR